MNLPAGTGPNVDQSPGPDLSVLGKVWTLAPWVVAEAAGAVVKGAAAVGEIASGVATVTGKVAGSLGDFYPNPDAFNDYAGSSKPVQGESDFADSYISYFRARNLMFILAGLSITIVGGVIAATIFSQSLNALMGKINSAGDNTGGPTMPRVALPPAGASPWPESPPVTPTPMTSSTIVPSAAPTEMSSTQPPNTSDGNSVCWDIGGGRNIADVILPILRAGGSVTIDNNRLDEDPPQKIADLDDFNNNAGIVNQISNNATLICAALDGNLPSPSDTARWVCLTPGPGNLIGPFVDQLAAGRTIEVHVGEQILRIDDTASLRALVSLYGEIRLQGQNFLDGGNIDQYCVNMPPRNPQP